MRTRGFTVVELIITITIMGILLLLAVVNLSASQLSARDAERVADIEIIASHLEGFYRVGYDNSPSDVGRYPSAAFTTSGGEAFILQVLRDINPDALRAPGVTSPTLSLISATNNSQTTTGVLPQPTINQYVYQPINADGSLDSTGTTARKYNLYYRLEKDNAVYMVTSKNR